MKKVLAILLALAMVLSMAACTKKEETVVEETKSALDGFPAQGFTVIVPVAAGAAVDITARLATDGLDLGSTITIENLKGASQTVGTAEMVNRGTDGYTLGVVAPAGFISQPLVNKDLTYKSSDFTVLSMISAAPNTTISVKAGSELADAEKFVEWLKTCDSYTYGVANIGGINQLAIDQFLIALGVYEKGNRVVYTSSAETDAAVLNGDVQFTGVDDDQMVKKLTGDQFACVMSCTKEANALLPDVPYAGQFVSDYVNVPGFKAFVCPAGVDEEIKNYLAEKIVAHIQSDEYQEKLVASGYAKMSGDDFLTGDALQSYFDAYAAVAETVLKATGDIE